MLNFYGKHRQNLSVLTVAMFVVSMAYFLSPSSVEVAHAGEVTTANAYLAANQQYNHFDLNTFSASTLNGFFQDVAANPQNWVYEQGSTLNQIVNLTLFSGSSGGWVNVATGEVYTDVGKLGQKYGINYDNYSATSGPNQAANYAKAVAGGNKVAEINKQNQANVDAAKSDAAKSSSGNTIQQYVGSMVAWFLYYIAYGLGMIMLLVTKVMLAIAVFNNFMGQTAVQVGWTVVRDICNNFFIIFMMIMAAGVTLKLPNYQWRSQLPKILIFAVLINFSLMLTGILIDVSQILMLTFASPLSTIQGYNIIISAFHLPDAFSMTVVLNQWKDSTGQITGQGTVTLLDIVAALVFAIIVTIVSIIVIACIAVILIYRIIMLMFLLILSPLYFLTRASNVPQLGSISSEWTGLLTKMLTVGPAMMFFLYLSFLTMAAVNSTPGSTMLSDTNVNKQVASTANLTNDGTTQTSILNGSTGLSKTDASQNDYINLSGMASVSGLLNFMVVIGFLWVSLMMGQKFGDRASFVAGKGMGWIASGAKKYSGFNLGKKGVGQLLKAPGAVISGVKATAGTGILGVTGAATRALGRATGSVGIEKLGGIAGAWRQDLLGARSKTLVNKAKKFMKNRGFEDKTVAAVGEFTATDLAKGIKRVGLTATGAAAGMTAAGLASLATVASGGLAAPLLAGIAASYVGGGRRVAEMELGDWGKRRAAKKTAAADELNKAKLASDQEQALSEEKLKSEIDAADEELKIRKKQADDLLKIAKDSADAELQAELERLQKRKEIDAQAAEDRIKAIGDSKVGNVYGKDLDPILLQQLEKIKMSDGHQWTSGIDYVTEDLLNKAKSDLKSNPGYAKLEREKEDAESKFAERSKDRQERHDSKIEVAEAANRSRISRFEEERRDKTEEAQEAHAGRISSSQANLAAVTSRAESRSKQSGALNAFLADYEPYAHPNWITQKAAEDATKEAKRIKGNVSALERNGEITDFAKGSFYSNSGQTESQQKLFSAISASDKAIQKITEHLEELSKQEKISDKSTIGSIIELKKGFAAQLKDGKDMSKLKGVMDLLNGLNNLNSPKDKSISEFQEEMKTS